LTSLPRAAFLAGFGALGAAAALGSPTLAQVPGARTRIDVHRHLSPPNYAADSAPAHLPMFPKPLADWTAERSIADMDAAGIAMAMLSMPATPGVFYGDAPAARKLSRSSNEYMASLKRSSPGRYGMFAVLPMPDVDGSLAEIAYAYDQLKSDGIGLFSSYGPALFLGDPKFAPVWEELDRRRALVFVHPAGNACCNTLQPYIGEAAIEYGTDTTRTIASLVFSGFSQRFPNVRVIFSHGGGTLPFLIERFTLQARNPDVGKKFPNGIEAEFKRYYYDTAFVTNTVAMSAMTALWSPSHILFGTDFPYRDALPSVNELASCGLTPDQQSAITHANALAYLHA
jgi:predicted TIM-barrel fold metal-dependent hydrolase